MQVHSVVRQWSLLAVVAVLLLPATVGLLFVLAWLLRVPGLESPILAGAGAFLVLIAAALVVACLLSLTIRASVGPDGLTSGEIGGRWSLPWSAVHEVWIVSHRGQPFLAVLPAPGARVIRTAWRARRMGLPEVTRTVRIAPQRVPALAAAVTAYRGVPPQSRVG